MIEEESMSENSNATVVLVDDEEMVLTSLQSLLNLETDYAIESFKNPADALAFIKENDIHVVVSDYLMPEMDGITFLGEVRKIRPDVPRIILTGYADKENAIKAINEVGLFQYIEKPWDNDDLLIIIRNGLERSQLLRKLQEKISEIDEAYGELQGMHKQILKTFI
jgi:DNA-binding NtrC family response regulator